MDTFTCTKCSCEFSRIGVFVAHYRHKHTSYDAIFEDRKRDLAHVKGMTNFQKKLMAKEDARRMIEKDIEEQVALIESKRGEREEIE